MRKTITIKKWPGRHVARLLAGVLAGGALSLASCAKMGNPDGGWYDETPPHVVGAMPEDGATHVKTRKVSINFDEFIKIDDAQNKVVVSPPQLESPEIKSEGKRIRVSLKDSLKANTTYTIDFSDAISDNNEGNPLGNYTYSFSTGGAIDTLEVSGYVLEAKNLEPVKGILVGLYGNMSDTAFTHEPMLRVSRTDSRGRFVIKGIAPGEYRVYALQDADGNYLFSQKSEAIAFSHDTIVPTSKPDVRQDTLWTDSLHIKGFRQVPYTHFLPDDICLLAFQETLTDRYFLKAERKSAELFTLFFSYGDKQLPRLRGLNFDERDAFIVEPSEHNDTVSYWLRDTALVNQDTLRMEVQYQMTDSLGRLVPKTDTLDVLSKEPYAKRMKKLQDEREQWEKQQKKKEKRGEATQPFRKIDALKPDIDVSGSLDPDRNIRFTFPSPLAAIDSAKLHLYARHDSLWYRAAFEFEHVRGREYLFRGEWRPEIEYSLEIDSAAFTDIYGRVSDAVKQGFVVKGLDDYSTLLVSINGMEDSVLVVQLLDGSDKVVKQVEARDGQAEFYFLKPGKYYMRLFADRNGNGIWDTGDYARDLQPEPVYYYPDAIECRAKWDVSRSWNPVARPRWMQKPGDITKQKAEAQKKQKSQNAERARRLGIEYVPKP